MPQMTGGCSCGQIRYSANVEPMFTGVCHCTNCQKQSGTAFNVVVAIPAAALSIQGSTKTYAARATAAMKTTASSARTAARRSSPSRP